MRQLKDEKLSQSKCLWHNNKSVFTSQLNFCWPNSLFNHALTEVKLTTNKSLQRSYVNRLLSLFDHGKSRGKVFIWLPGSRGWLSRWGPAQQRTFRPPHRLHWCWQAWSEIQINYNILNSAPNFNGVLMSETLSETWNNRWACLTQIVSSMPSGFCPFKISCVIENKMTRA